MAAKPSIAGRAFAAVALLVGFYVLALAIAAGLLYIPYADWQSGDGLDSGRIAFFCVVSALIILWSIVPRVEHFDPPGPRLTPDTQRRLFSLIRKVANATKQEMPAEVYAVADLNAWVAQRGGVMGYGSRRVMGLGLPLLSQLSVAQFSAVLAHEFGHYYGGDTKLGPWIYKTHSTIGRTLENLSQHSGLLTKPFEWYGLLFLRITQAASRAQEFSADALAARTVGGQALADGLRIIHSAGPAFGAYWNQEYAPLLMTGYRPPFQAGFQSFMSEEGVVQAVQNALQQELTAPQVDPHDTHPPLPDRLRAVPADPTKPQWVDDAAAITLLDDVPGVEHALIDFVAGPDEAPKLKPIAWADAPRLVWAPEWQRAATAERKRLSGITPLVLANLTEPPGGLAVALGYVSAARDATLEHVAEANRIFGAGLATLLLSRGWDVRADPGAPVVLSSGPLQCEPFAAWPRIAEGDLTREDWAVFCGQAGIAEVDLGARFAGA